MSFVGITFILDHIIAFADSKSSREVKEGAGVWEQNGTVQKLFKTNDFICVFFGSNEIPILKNGNEEKVKLEDIINPMINNYSDPNKFYMDLYSKITKLAYREFGEIRGISAYRYNKNIYYILFNASMFDLSINNKIITRPDALYGGCNDYVLYFNAWREYLMSVDPNYIKRNIEKTIETIQNRHDKNWYNPVGGKIVVEEL